MDIDDAKSIELEIDESTPFSMTGNLGIDMLVNKRRSGNPTRSDSDLNEMVRDLDEGITLEETKHEPEKSTFFSNLFGGQKPTEEPRRTFNLSSGTVEEKPQVSETWDGFKRVSDIPVQPDAPPTISMSKEEMVREKFKILKKLEELQQKHGIQLSKQYSMESSFLEMKGEYETILAEREKTNSVRFQGQLLKTAIDGLEFLNHKIDPFDLKLDGWGESVGENITDYNDIFEELHEKYKSRMNISPELKLFFQLVSSAVTVHITNLAFSSIAPSSADILKQNPELARHITEAAMKSVGEKGGGVANFAQDMMNHGRRPEVPEPRHMPSREPQQEANKHVEVRQEPVRQAPPMMPKRAEMKGPENIDDLLAKMRGGSVRSGPIPQPQKEPRLTSMLPPQRPPQQPPRRPNPPSPVFSVDDIKSRGSTPKSKRNRTERNTISLDL
jgi:hypothetical protein